MFIKKEFRVAGECGCRVIGISSISLIDRVRGLIIKFIGTKIVPVKEALVVAKSYSIAGCNLISSVIRCETAIVFVICSDTRCCITAESICNIFFCDDIDDS